MTIVRRGGKTSVESCRGMRTDLDYSESRHEAGRWSLVASLGVGSLNLSALLFLQDEGEPEQELSP